MSHEDPCDIPKLDHVGENEGQQPRRRLACFLSWQPEFLRLGMRSMRIDIRRGDYHLGIYSRSHVVYMTDTGTLCRISYCCVHVVGTCWAYLSHLSLDLDKFKVKWDWCSQTVMFGVPATFGA